VMNQWAVTDFVSRVAERVTTARGGLVAQLADRRGGDDFEVAVYAQLRSAFPSVEPSPEFVAELYQRLMQAPALVPEELVVAAPADRRVVYGAAIGSLASAAVIAAVVLRYRAAHRAAA